MGTFDITLPTDQVVVFPARCVVCEKPNPNGTIKLSFLGANSSTVLDMTVQSGILDDSGARNYSSNTLNKIDGIPVCSGCESSLKWYHRLLKFGYYTAWLPGVGLIFLGLPVWISVTVVVVGAMTPGLIAFFLPPSFGASFYSGIASFEFKSKLVAEEFLELNSEAILKSKDKIEPIAA